MTNFEHYSKLYPELIMELISNNRNHNMLAFSIDENKPVACYNMQCSRRCKFYDGTNDGCKEKIRDWLEAPYEGADYSNTNTNNGGISW